MTAREVKKLFKKAGWIIGAGAKHDYAENPVTGQKIPIPRHRGDIPPGTLSSILKAAGLSKN